LKKEITIERLVKREQETDQIRLELDNIAGSHPARLMMFAEDADVG
jgi:hypothetical protein